MSTFYNLTEDTDKLQVGGFNKTENISECQKNRNRNMAHSIGLDYDLLRVTNSKTTETTPMSTATDQFTVSTHSGSNQEQHSCANTPFSEITNLGYATSKFKIRLII